MIGYLLCDPSSVLNGFKSPDQWPLKTWKNVLDEEYNNCRLLLFKNGNPNNYFVNDKDLLVSISGTLIHEGKRGLGAAETIAESVRAGARLEKIYEKSFGPFNLLIVDKKFGQLTLLTDREGMQGAFLYNRNGQRIVSSNLLMLAAISGVGVDPLGAGEYLHLGHCWQWRTIFNGIERIRGGAKFWKEDGVWKTKRLWKIDVTYPYTPDNDPVIIKNVSALIDGSINDVMKTLQKPVGLDLTGGTDSRTVLSFLYKNKDRVEATTAGPSTHIDVVIASKITKKLELPFYWFEDRPINSITHDQIECAVEFADGFLPIPTVIKILGYYQEKAQRYDIMMGGCGGPLFKDHYWLYEFNRINKLREPNWERIASLSTTDSPIDDNLTPGFKSGIRQHIKNILLDHSLGVRGTNNQKLDYVYFDLKCQNVIAPQFGLTNKYVDLYHPLMDGRIVQYVINSKPFIRKWNNLEFSLIFNNNEILAWIPTDNGMPAVPSVGRNLYLRSYIGLRYAKAAVRKIKMLALRKAANESPHLVDNIIEMMHTVGYQDILNYNEMKLSGIVDKLAFNRIKGRNVPVGYRNYIVNIVSAELSYGYCDNLRKNILVYN